MGCGNAKPVKESKTVEVAPAPTPDPHSNSKSGHHAHAKKRDSEHKFGVSQSFDEDADTESSVQKSPTTPSRPPSFKRSASVPTKEEDVDEDPYAAQAAEADADVQKHIEEAKKAAAAEAQHAGESDAAKKERAARESEDEKAKMKAIRKVFAEGIPSVSAPARLREWLHEIVLPTDPNDIDYDATSVEVRRRVAAPKTEAAATTTTSRSDGGSHSPRPQVQLKDDKDAQCLDAFGVTDAVLAKADKINAGEDSDEDSESVNDSEWMYCLDELQKEYEDREAGGGGSSPTPDMDVAIRSDEGSV